MTMNRNELAIIQRGIAEQQEMLLGSVSRPEELFLQSKANLERKYERQISQVKGFTLGEMASNHGALDDADYELIKGVIDGFMIPSPAHPREHVADMFERAKVELTEVLTKYLDMTKTFTFQQMFVAAA